ncbi:MAG: ABC transporter substrate-binding protein [Dongiaceae bacterium]
MRKFGAIAFAAAMLAGSLGAQAADPLTLQLKWVTQAQFAGYYVAKDKGMYDEVGLDVTIKPGGPDINPSQVIAGGGADVVLDWMPSALATREKGVPLINIAQVFQKSGMMLTCRKDTGIAAPADFKGKTLGVWFAGNEYPFLSWMNHLGLGTSGGADGVTVLKQGFNVDPLLQKQADCISTMTYNEYWQVIDAGLSAEDLVVFPYEDQGVATLEDGIYTLEASLQDPEMVDKLMRFVKASMQGWDWSVANPDDAAMIVLENDETGAQSEKHQKRLMGEIA